MNNEKLILDCFRWLIKNTKAISNIDDEDGGRLLMEIGLFLNQKEDVPYAESLSQTKGEKNDI